MESVRYSGSLIGWFYILKSMPNKNKLNLCFLYLSMLLRFVIFLVLILTITFLSMLNMKFADSFVEMRPE